MEGRANQFQSRTQTDAHATKMILEKGYLVINPKFNKLITSLRTAVDNEGALDKEITYDDILDALRLSLKNVEFEKPRH